MEKIDLKILGISSGQGGSSYTLILEEKDGERKLPVIIGAFEAQAIAIEIEKIVPVRPMTHDLFKTFAKTFGVSVKEVIIHQLQEGIFYSHIICSDGNKEYEIDARTSDAIAVALRFKSPIYTYESILQEAGIILSELNPESFEQADPKKEETGASASGQKSSGEKELGDLSKKELEEELNKSIEEENYIKAAQIRDEIKKREGTKGSDGG